MNNIAVDGKNGGTDRVSLIMFSDHLFADHLDPQCLRAAGATAVGVVLTVAAERQEDVAKIASQCVRTSVKTPLIKV